CSTQAREGKEGRFLDCVRSTRGCLQVGTRAPATTCQQLSRRSLASYTRLRKREGPRRSGEAQWRGGGPLPEEPRSPPLMEAHPNRQDMRVVLGASCYGGSSRILKREVPQIGCGAGSRILLGARRL